MLDQLRPPLHAVAAAETGTNHAHAAEALVALRANGPVIPM
jgi:hypothetical protein